MTILGDDSALEEAKKARSKEIPASVKSPKSRARKSSESSSVDDAKVQKKSNKSDSDSDIKKKAKPTPTAKKTQKAGSASEKSRDSSPAAPAPAPKRKPGPKSKPRPGPASSAKKDQKKPIEAKSAVNSMAFTEGDSITCCDDCDKIFLSRQVRYFLTSILIIFVSCFRYCSTPSLLSALDYKPLLNTKTVHMY